MHTYRAKFSFLVCIGLLWVPIGPRVLGEQGTRIDSPAKTDNVALSTPIVKAWQHLAVGVPVYVLDDLTATRGWLDRALVQYVGVQTGIWHIHIEPGYSVFRIYPYLAEGDRQPRVYQGIVLKVAGHLSAAELIAAIRERKATVVIDEYDLFGKGVSVQKYSRRKGQVPRRNSDSARPSNKSLDASGGSVFCNWLGGANVALMRAAASTPTLGSFALWRIITDGSGTIDLSWR